MLGSWKGWWREQWSENEVDVQDVEEVVKRVEWENRRIGRESREMVRA